MVVILVDLIDVRRDTEFYRPALEELPQSLRIGIAALLNDSDREFDMEYTRVLGYRAPGAQTSVALGIYSMMHISPTQFELCKWRMEVDYQSQDLGRRLLGHALGLAESKGGRHMSVCVPKDRTREIGVLERYGFVRAPEEQTWVFDIIPE